MNNKFKYLLAFVLLLLVSTCTFAQTETSNQRGYVLLISMDAFRHDYYDSLNTSTLRSIANNGVHAKSLISCYPTKTFSNHYSIATGLYPNNHGIVNNSFTDSLLGDYSIGNRESVGNGKFYGGEPIWVTAEKQGVKTASYFWVGSEAPIQGIQPSIWKPYDNHTSYQQQTDSIMKWFMLPAALRPHLVTFYYYQPDWTSHKQGPWNQQTTKLAEQLDSLLGNFIQQLETLPFADSLNIIVVSDHGMTETSSQRVINLSNHVSKEMFSNISGGNPVYSLQPYPEFFNEVLTKLKQIDHLNVWERHQIPPRYMYGSNPRINDILVEAEFGWSVGWTNKLARYNGGTHGYDNMNPEMHGIFFAQGPAFKQGYERESFMNIHIYSIIARILNLKPAITDGDISEVIDIFQ